MTLCLVVVMSRNDGFLSINAPFAGGEEREDVADAEGVLLSADEKPEEPCGNVRALARCCRRGGGGERLVYDSGGRVELEGANDRSGGAPAPPRERLKLGAEFALDKSDALRGSFEPVSAPSSGEEEPLRGKGYAGVFDEEDPADVRDVSDSREPQLLLALRSPILLSFSRSHAAPSRSSSAGGTMCCATSWLVRGDADVADAGSEPVPRSSNHEDEECPSAELDVLLSPALEAFMGVVVSTWSSSCFRSRSRSRSRSLSRSCLLTPNSFRRGLELVVESFPVLTRLGILGRVGGCGGESCNGGNEGEPNAGSGGDCFCSSEPGALDGSKEL